MKKETVIKIAAGAAASAAGVATGIGSAMLFNRTLPRPAGTSEDIIKEFADPAKMAEYRLSTAPVGEWMEKQNLEDVFIHSGDGLVLHAYYLPAETPSGRLVMLHHGFTSNAMDNSTHAMFFHSQGYEVLLLDARAHGKSEGQYVGFGILDRFDTLDWVRYCRERFGNDIRIVLHGTSMGGATVLMALGLPEIQETVSAVIADCAYTSPYDIFAYVIQKDYHLPAAPILKATEIRSKAVAGYGFSDCSTLDALKDNQVPVLLIHGKEDRFVPTWMSEKNYEVCPSKKRLLLVENAGHGSSVFENRELYEQTEKEFLEDVFAQEKEKDEVKAAENAEEKTEVDD
jgi:fermentation-respiration switch protein FrsA (DUF1100 family)